MGLLADELAKILSDGEWHSTSQLAILAGKYIRPEVAWRAGIRSHQIRGGEPIYQGKRKLVSMRLGYWYKSGKVEKRFNDSGTAEWRLTAPPPW